MNNVYWAIKTEFIQNRLNFSLMFLISLLLGAGIKLSLFANNKIESLAQPDIIKADIVVVPKGISLSDLKNELKTAKTTAFLPEALFDTTSSISNDVFGLTAFLAINDIKGPRILVKNNEKPVGLDWLRLQQKIAPWEPQNIYTTEDWKNKLIAGFFASGTNSAIQNLKKMINTKTVAQAIIISEQKKQDEEIQSEFRAGLLIYSGVLAVSIILTILSQFIWIEARISNCLHVFNEIGFSGHYKLIFVSTIIVMICVLPITLGFFAASIVYS